MNTKNKIFAIPAAAPASPLKPNKAAINANTTNAIVHLNMISDFLLVNTI